MWPSTRTAICSPRPVGTGRPGCGMRGPADAGQRRRVRPGVQSRRALAGDGAKRPQGRALGRGRRPRVPPAPRPRFGTRSQVRGHPSGRAPTRLRRRRWRPALGHRRSAGRRGSQARRGKIAVFEPSGQSLVTGSASGAYRWPITPSPASGPGACDRPRPRPGPAAGASARSGRAQPGRTIARDRLGLTLASGHPRPGRPAHDLLRLSHSALWSVAISPDGRWVATGSWNGDESNAWDATTGRRLHDFPGRSARSPLTTTAAGS